MRRMALWMATGWLLGVAAASAEQSATVTKTINDVDKGTGSATATSPAHPGTILDDGDFIKTGTKSLAELKLENQTITRVGSNTIFNYSAAHNELDLQSGTILFSKPKDGQQFKIKTAAVTAAVVGTTGFIQATSNGFVFGIIEGHGKFVVQGKLMVVGPGQMVVFIPGHSPVLFSFNVPQMISSSPLFTSFSSHLPNQVYIDEEIAAYLNDLHRGFIDPVNGGPTWTFQYSGKPNGVFDWNNALQGLESEFAPPPTTPTSECGYWSCCQSVGDDSVRVQSDLVHFHHHGRHGE